MKWVPNHYGYELWVVWMDIDVPLLAGYAFGVVNFHLARVIG